MVEHDIHAVVVMEDDQPIGVISQTDMVLARQGRSYEEARQLRAKDIMTPGCVTCDINAPLSDAISTMTRLRIHRLIVTENRDGRNIPIGVLSMTDIVRKTILG
jgi:crotonyl-CoA carboxylase/reductase